MNYLMNDALLLRCATSTNFLYHSSVAVYKAILFHLNSFPMNMRTTTLRICLKLEAIEKVNKSQNLKNNCFIFQLLFHFFNRKEHTIYVVHPK